MILNEFGLSKMRSTDNQPPPSPLVSFGRSILSFNRGQVHSMDNSSPSSHELGLESFHQMISDRFHGLSAAEADELLSLQWIQKLLNAFIQCQDDFRAIILSNKGQITKPPIDRMVSDFFERSVKALDICNAARDGIEQVRQWKKHLEIAASALAARQIHRAKKALADLALEMLEERETGCVFRQHRNRSFGRHQNNAGRGNYRASGHSRSNSWSVSRTWSAAKQLQSISSSISNFAPGSSVGISGLAFSMSFVLVFALWALVAAIPCQDRGGSLSSLPIPRQYSWAAPFMVLHERIHEESKRRDRRNSNGLLREIHQMERCTQRVMETVDSAQLSLTEELKKEVAEGAGELTAVCEVLENGLDPLERQVREMFRQIMGFRTEGLELLAQANV